jgi:hypothetical protein
MCDYSLHFVASRPAKVGDKLVSTEFDNCFTRGFAAVGEPNVAVCLLPGTEVAFEENVECEPSFGIGILPNKKISQRLARFRVWEFLYRDNINGAWGRWPQVCPG